MFEFRWPEDDSPAHMFNGMLDAPFEDEQDGIEKFTIRYLPQGWDQIQAKEPAFLNRTTGEILVLRSVDTQEA